MPTLADWLLFSHLIRFDAVENILFKANIRRICDYQHLQVQFPTLLDWLLSSAENTLSRPSSGVSATTSKCWRAGSAMPTHDFFCAAVQMCLVPFCYYSAGLQQ